MRTSADTEGWSNGRDSNLTTSWSFSGNNTYVLSRSLAEDGGPEDILFADQFHPSLPGFSGFRIWGERARKRNIWVLM